MNDKERKILKFVKNSWRDGVIAEAMNMKVDEVQKIIRSLQNRLGATSRTDLVVKAIKKGLV